jgi:hypothetical protein
MMGRQSIGEVAMGEVLSLAEMKQHYDGEWLLIINAELDRNSEILSGKVLAHSANVDEIYDALPLAKGVEASIEYVRSL